MDRVEQAVRTIIRSAHTIENRLAWIRGGGGTIDPEMVTDIAEYANDIQTQVEKILKEIQK